MTDNAAQFCTKCGTTFRADTAFCTKCGAPRRTSVTPSPAAAPTAAAPATAPTFVAQTAPAATSVAGAYGTVASVAGMAGFGMALPWQTVVGAERPDIGAFLSMAAMPAAQQLMRSSLKRPGIAMAITTALDLGTTVLSGGTSAIGRALPRVAMGAVTSVLSITTGSKGGSMRLLTGLVSLATAGVQIVFAVGVVKSGAEAGTPVLTLLPGIVVMLSSLVVAVRTASAALGRN